MLFMKAMVCCITISGWCIAQSITISGTVKDTSGIGISGALVKLEQAHIATTTGSDGSFILKKERKISLASVKQTRITAQKADMLSVTKEGMLNYRITVKNLDTTGITITMLPNAGNVTDADGNVYQSVRIGNQVWTVENLKTTKYNDGAAIPLVADSAAWCTIYSTASTSDAYCFYKDKYGAFYNWYAVGTGKLAPKGWRVPTDADWDTLQNYLIAHGYNYDGTTTENKIAKSMAAQWDWDSSTIEGAVGNDLSKNNASGFSALPGGIRHWGGSFYSLFLERTLTYWWSSTEYDSVRAWHRWLDCHHSYLDRTFHHKNTGFAVRILRDLK